MRRQIRLLLLRCLIPSWIQWEGYETINEALADVNDDGAVTAVDRMLLVRHRAGWKIDVPLNLYAADLDQEKSFYKFVEDEGL